MPPGTAGIVDREIVVAQHGEHAEWGLQVAEEFRGRSDVLWSAVDEVAGERDHVRPLGQRSLQGAFDVTDGDVAAVMKVAEVRDLQPPEGRGQPGDRQRDTVHFQPRRLDVSGVPDSGPGTADEPGDADLEGRAVRERVDVV